MVRDCYLDGYVFGIDIHRVSIIPHTGANPEEGHYKRVDVLLDRISNCTQIMNDLPARQKQLEREQQLWAAEQEEKQRLASAERYRLRLNEQHKRRQRKLELEQPHHAAEEQRRILAAQHNARREAEREQAWRPEQDARAARPRTYYQSWRPEDSYPHGPDKGGSSVVPLVITAVVSEGRVRILVCY